MVWFWQLRGRTQGGVFIVFAPPGEGKSYVGTAIGLELMKDNVIVFSNWPIVSVDGKYCSRKYEGKEKMQQRNLNGCAVLIDESYKEFSSRKWESFTDEDHDWLATSGHNEMIMYFFTQNVARIDKVIREVLNLVLEVHKIKIPFFDLPLWFTVYSYLSIEDMQQSKWHDIQPYKTERFRFTVDVALAYDTKFFKKHTGEPVYMGQSWIDWYKEQGIEYQPVKYNFLQVLKYRYFRDIGLWIHKNFNKIRTLYLKIYWSARLKWFKKRQ